MSEKKNTPVIDTDEILKGIREWVNIESPSNDGESVNRQVIAVFEWRDCGERGACGVFFRRADIIVEK